jgi:hypothetical protein
MSTGQERMANQNVWRSAAVSVGVIVFGAALIGSFNYLWLSNSASAAVDGRLKRLEDGLGDIKGLSALNANTEARLKTLEGRITDLKGIEAQLAGLSKDVETAKTEISTLRTNVSLLASDSDTGKSTFTNIQNLINGTNAELVRLRGTTDGIWRVHCETT